MTESGSATTIEEIAKSLREQRDQGQPPLLFLGARAGEFYRNAEFYRELEPLIPGFQELSDTEKFRRCYEVLGSYHSEQKIYDILSLASKTRAYRNEDSLLVELVQAGFADTIITTHIGTLLENAFIPTSLKESQDYQIILPERLLESRDIYRLSNSRYCRIFKIFGDLESQKYNTAGRVFNLEKDRILKGFWESELQRVTLLIGHDPAWDREIESAFLPSGGTLWYINEEAPPHHSHLARILQQRPSKVLLGPEGDFGKFMQALYEQSVRNTNLPLTSESRAPAPPAGSPPRKKAFISYAHADRRYLDRFEIHLKANFHDQQNLLSIWKDRDIQDGDLWQERIEQALESASVAILLVSTDFLASDYIWKHELPVLLKAAEEKKVTLLSFVLSPCRIQQTDLMKYQIVNDLDGSFCNLNFYKRECWWDNLARQTFELLHTA